MRTRLGMRGGRTAIALVLVLLGTMTPALGAAPIWSSPAAPGSPGAPRPCPAGAACIIVDPTHRLGPVDLVAQGLLFGVDATTNPALIDALHPDSWRTSPGDAAATAAQQSGAAVTDVLSNAWYDQFAGRAPTAPWSNWAAYASWVQATVRATVASGESPDYWEIQNEPDGFYQSLPPETTAEALHQYALAARIIRSIDPKAKIEGPSLLGYFDTPGQPTIDMKTFLDFVSANHLPLDALSWHEVIGAAVDRNPNVVQLHAAAARTLLSHYPTLAHLPLFINEYSSNATHLIPGWAVGWIASLENAGVAEAARACWHEPDVTGKKIAECNGGSLDGLLQPGSGLPQDLYWVHLYYAEMSGARVSAVSNDGNVSAYATYNASNNQITVLVGRHASCTAAIRVDCTQPASATPPAKNVVVEILAPKGWVTAVLTTARIPNVNGPVSPPVPTPGGSMAASAITFNLAPGGVADGDAYVVNASAG